MWYINLDRSFYRFAQFTCVTDGWTDRRTDRQTEFSSLDRVCIPCSAVIKILRRVNVIELTNCYQSQCRVQTAV